MDVLELRGRSLGDPFPQYALKSVTGPAGGTLPPGTVLYQTLYWDGTQWRTTSELSVDPTTPTITITEALITGTSECTGNWLIHGASGIKLEIDKSGPGLRIFAVHTDTDKIEMFGALVLKRTSVASSPYAVVARDNYLAVDTNAARTINLPAASAGERLLVVADVVGTGAVVNNITIARNGADTINQVGANYVINTAIRASRMFYSDGTSNWEVLAGLL